jgi:hypothetical protein
MAWAEDRVSERLRESIAYGQADFALWVLAGRSSSAVEQDMIALLADVLFSRNGRLEVQPACRQHCPQVLLRAGGVKWLAIEALPSCANAADREATLQVFCKFYF